jgi:hypothetical protein
MAHRRKEIAMNRKLCCVSLALTALALLGVAVPMMAQQAPQDMIPFKATLTGSINPAFVIPIEPPIASDSQTSTGQATELGQVTYTEHSITHFGPDGKIAFISDGTSALVAANGDAVFLTYSGLLSGAGAQFGYTITGGRGRFKGATGSGVVLCVRDKAKNEFVRTFDGTLSAPKP